MAVLAPTNSGLAQPQVGQFVGGMIGYGLSSSSDRADHSMGQGALVGAEFVHAPNAWVGVRPYATVVATWHDRDDARCAENVDWDCDVSSHALLVGGKGRFVLPIPFIAPFIELGLGLTLGSLTTRTYREDRQVNGALIHIPVGLGLAFGEQHEFEVGLAYYFQPAARQVNGGFTLGMAFRVD